MVNIGGFVNNFDAHVIQQILIRGTVKTQVYACIFRSDFEVILSEDVVFAFLKWQEVTSVLLVLEPFLGLQVFLLGYYRNLSHGRAYKHSESKRSVQVGLYPESLLIRLLWLET